MASAVDSRLAYARLSAVATASRLPTANRDSNNSYTTSWDTTQPSSCVNFRSAFGNLTFSKCMFDTCNPAKDSLRFRGSTHSRRSSPVVSLAISLTMPRHPHPANSRLRYSNALPALLLLLPMVNPLFTIWVCFTGPADATTSHARKVRSACRSSISIMKARRPPISPTPVTSHANLPVQTTGPRSQRSFPTMRAMHATNLIAATCVPLRAPHP